MVSHFYMSFAPPEKGGRGDIKEKVTGIVDQTGRPLAEVAEEVRVSPCEDQTSS